MAVFADAAVGHTSGVPVSRLRGTVAAAAVGVLALASTMAATLGGGAAADAASSPAAAPMSATVTIVGTFGGFLFTPSKVTVAKGGTLTVVNATTSAHTFTSDALGSDGNPIFYVTLPPLTTANVPIATLGGGTYTFYCTVHPSMTGTLVIDGPPDGSVSDIPKFEQPLVQPPRLTGRHITVVMKKADVRMLPHGPKTPMWTFGGTFPGPTIVARTGHDTHVTFVNHLPRAAGSMTIHEHGGHHASKDDGQPTTYLIRHGHQRTYDYPLVNAGRPVPAGLGFYHDHRMGVTARNNWRGLQGMFLVTDPREDRLGLPHGAYDVPLMFTDRSFTASNRLTDPFQHAGMSGMDMSGMDMPGTDTATVGSRVLVNGRFAPYLRVKPGRYRLRLLNASLFSSYDFALSDGRPFTQVGTGSGLLPHPVVRQDILLGPAQRADVVVDFRGRSGSNVLLSSIRRSDGPTTGIGTRSSALLKFRVRGTTGQHARVPATLAHIPKLRLPQHIAKTWTFGTSIGAHGSYWSINGRRYNPRRVDYRVPLGATQMWRLRNTSTITHYVHLHEELWHTVSRDGLPPPPWERGFEDTWRLDPGETVVVAAKFTDYTGRFMVHCHMLDHEDDGMMATFKVVRR
jgi:spore coat protein A